MVLHRYFNGELKIKYNGQDIEYEELEGRKPKEGYKYMKPDKEHPWRKQNNLIESKKNKKFANKASV